MTTTGLASAFGAARASILAAVAFSAAINLLVLAAPFYADLVTGLMPLHVGGGGLAGLCLLGVAALGALAMIDEARGRLMARIATFFEAHLAPRLRSRRIADGDLARLRRVIGGPAATALLDLPWLPFFLAALFLVHPVLGAGAAAGTVLIVLLGVGALLWRDNPHAASAAWIAQLIMQAVAFAVIAALLFAGELSVSLGLASAVVVRRALGPVQANAGGWRDLSDAWSSIERLHALARRDAALPIEVEAAGSAPLRAWRGLRPGPQA